MKQEKMVKVYTLCPYDMEMPVVYFETREDAEESAKLYRQGAHVSGPDMVPKRIVERKLMRIAKYGHVL